MPPTAVLAEEVGTTSDVRSEIAFTRPTRAEVQEAIREDARAAGVWCSPRQAGEFVALLHRAVTHIREGGGVYHVTQHELNRLHNIMDVVMPDDVTDPAPDSAHDRINRYLIRGREFAIVHTRTGESRRAQYCAIAIAMRRI